MEYIFSLNNTTGSVLSIADLDGWDMPVGVNSNILDEFDFGDLAGSDNLETAITSGQVVVQFDGSDLSAADGVDFVKRANAYSLQEAIDDLEGSTATDITNLQTEVNNIETSLDLNEDGTFKSHTSTNYMDSASNASEARVALDTATKVNEDAILAETTARTAADAALQTALDAEEAARIAADAALDAEIDDEANARIAADANLQTALDAEEAARIAADAALQTNLDNEVTARTAADAALDAELTTTQASSGLNPDGTYVNRTGTNYLDASTTLYQDSTILDIAIKQVSDDLASLGSGSITDLQTEVNNIETALDLNTDGTFKQHVGTNYMDAATTAAGAREALDTQLKTTDDKAVQNAADIITTNTALAVERGRIDQNITDIATNASAISSEASARAGADSAIQSELDNVEAAAGLDANGNFVSHTGSNYLDAAGSMKAVDVALDAAAKANADAIAALDASTGSDLATKLNLDGSNGPMTGNLDMGNNHITTTKTPAGANELTNKQYVDMMVQGVAPKASVDAATNDPLPSCTYNNGTNGLGATLSGTGAFPTIDGVASVIGNTYVINGQGNSVENGTYVLTADSDWVLTRRTDMDGTPANELAPGTTVPVFGGDTWAGYIFYITGDAGDNKIPGTDAINMSYVPVSTATAAVQAEIDAIEASFDLNADGTYKGHTGTNYLDAIGTAKSALEKLDIELKAISDQTDTNTTNITNNTSAINNIQTDIGDIQAMLTDVTVIDGVIYGKDGDRGKWMGPTVTWSFGRKRNIKDRYLMLGGEVSSNLTGARVHRTMCITSMAVQLSAVAGSSTVIEVRKNNSASPIAQVTVNGVAGIHVNDLDVDLAAGDYLQVYVNGGKVSNPFVTVTAAYKESL